MIKLNSELKAFVDKYSWEKQMNRSQGLDSFSNYSGPSMGDWVVVIGRNRDSDILAESNFQAALDQLGGESKHVQVHRFGHWGCGWIELILVSPTSVKYLKKAKAIKEQLDQYPVLDEEDYSERETEYQSDYANGVKDELAEALSKHFNLTNSRALEDIAFELNMTCQQYYGNDACIDIYPNIKPDARDVDRLRTCLDQIKYNFNASKVFKKLYQAVQK